MKTRKHGCGLRHKEVVRFSNRLASMQHYSAVRNSFYSDFEEGYYVGWSACAQYFAHCLREYLRECEFNEVRQEFGPCRDNQIRRIRYERK